MLIERLPARLMLTIYLPGPTIGEHSFIYATPPNDNAFRTHAYATDSVGGM